MNIKELIATGPCPRYQLRAVALKNYHDITRARELRYPWIAITTALGLPASRWRGLARAWHKVGEDYGRNPPAAFQRESESPEQRPKLPRVQKGHKADAHRVLDGVEEI